MVLVYIWIALQIIIEVVPISSSGHLQLFQEILWQYRTINIADFLSKRGIVIEQLYYLMHLPTLIAVLICFWSSWITLFFLTVLSIIRSYLRLGRLTFLPHFFI